MIVSIGVLVLMKVLLPFFYIYYLVLITFLETPQFFKDVLIANFKDFKEKSLRGIIALNYFLNHKSTSHSIIDLALPDVPIYLARDFELLKNSKFRWEDIDLSAIEDRTELLLLLNKPIPNLILPIISTRPFELFFPLKFLDLIAERPNNWFGEAVYNKSLEYYTCLLECFLQFYLEKDLCFLDKLESEDMKSYSLIGRRNVREKNQRNEEIKSRYFNDIFNLKNFALKLVRNFIPAATWRWIGANHKCHILSIKLCKILIEYQFLTLNEIE